MPFLPPPLAPFTQADLLGLFDRLFPLGWLSGLKDPGPGYEVLQTFAQVCARVSQSICTFAGDSYITSGQGGQVATGQVEIYRPGPNVEGITVTVKAGTVVKTSEGGRDFITTADAVFAPSDVGPFTVGVMAVAQGYEWNVPGQVVLAAEVLPGAIDTIKTLVEDPQMGDLTIKVRQLVATSGGRDAALDALGHDRGIDRNLNESDDSYRTRIGALPDTITPDAVERSSRAALDPVGAGYTLLEAWDVAYQTCYDAPRSPISGSNFDPNCFVFDDPRAPVPFRNRWLDENELRGCFIVVAEDIQPLSDTGMSWDDTAMDFSGTRSTVTGGLRGLTAYDVPSTLAFGYLHGAWDGYDAPKQALYLGLYQTLQSIKAAGNTAVVELKGQ
jgi:hypothetical protein